MKKHEGKGVAGKKTGAPARKLIRELEKKGMTQEQIGRKARRSASTIGQIKSGDIKNPPNDLVKRLRK